MPTTYKVLGQTVTKRVIALSHEQGTHQQRSDVDAERITR